MTVKISKGFKRYFSNTLWLFAERVVRLAVAFVVGVYVARYLGPQDFGQLSYVISFVGLFAAFAALGLDTIVVRELVQTKDFRNELLGSAFVLRLFGLALVLIILLAIIHFASVDSLTSLMILIVAFASLFQSLYIIDFYFQSKVLSKYPVRVKLFSVVVVSTVRLILIYLRAPLLFFALAVLVESAVVAFGFLIAYKKQRLSALDWRFQRQTAVGLLRNSWPLIITGVAISIYLKIDQVMIKEMLGVPDVGNYAAAVRCSEAFYFIPLVIVNSLFPAIINAKKTDARIYVVRLQQLYDLMVWMGAIIALIVALLAEPITGFLYGEHFADAGGILTIHIWALVFVFMGQAGSRWFLAENMQIQLTLMHVGGSVANICLNLVLIPRLGTAGAAWATVVAYAFASYFNNLIFGRSRSNFVMLSKSLDPLGVLWRNFVLRDGR